MSMPTHHELVEVTCDERKTIGCLISKNYISDVLTCHKFDKTMKICTKQDHHYFHCLKCRGNRSIFQGCIFSNSKLSFVSLSTSCIFQLLIYCKSLL